MQTRTLKTRTDHNGIIRLEVLTDMVDREMEIVLVMQTVETKEVDAMGYPLGYFERTYGMFADDPIERN